MVSLERRPLLATYYLLYGISKILIALSLMTFPLSILDKIPLLNYFIITTEDDSFAGHYYEYILMIFGIYTIIMSLSLLHILPYFIRSIVENKKFEYSIFILLGLALIIFYSLVIYTDLPIQKSKKDDDIFHYKVLGIGGGISFLLIPCILEFINYFFPIFKGHNLETRSIIILTGSIIFIICLGYVLDYFKERNLSIAFTKQGIRIAKDGYIAF
jgi:hypothetical protein